jgi:SAM-dependent methyltransferase
MPLRPFRLSRLLKPRKSHPPAAVEQFDEESYWIERHEQLRGDIRSVGNLGTSEEKNLAGLPQHRARLKTVLQHLVPDASDKMALDLGSGIGRLAPVFLELGYRYTGVEVSPVAVEQARQACPDDAADYQDRRRFDVIVASYVLVHIVKDEEWVATLGSIASWLRDDGYFVLIDEVPTEPAPQRNRRHFVLRTVGQYEEALSRCGLRFADSWRTTDRDALGADKFGRYFVIERQDSRRPPRPGAAPVGR